MRKTSILILMLMCVVGIIYAADKTKGKISFEETVYDFGTIKEDGGPVTHEFVFTNAGKDPIKIVSAKAECGCTRPEFPKEEINPGEKGVIKVTYNPLGRPGGFTKAVTVRATGNPGKVVLKIRGNVTPRN